MTPQKNETGVGAGYRDASQNSQHNHTLNADFPQVFTYGVCQNALDHNVRTVTGDFSEFVAGLAHPVVLAEKKHGKAIVPAAFATPYAVNKNVLGLTGLALDIEGQTGGPQPPAPDLAAEYLRSTGLTYCLWTTHSHTPHAPRYRILFPLEGLLAPEHVKTAYTLLGGSLPPFASVTDPSCWHPARLFFLPSIHPERAAHYRWFANTGGKRLKAVRLAEAVKILEEKALAEAAEKRQLKMLRKPMGNGSSLIQKFNASHSVAELLQAAGYIKKGKKWLAPNSGSGIPGLVVFENGRAYSHHNNDALNDGRSHDSFGIYALIWHDGNASAACKALRRAS
ncbi:hypothetical protein [Ferrovum myxofaciens]|uniref:hypothetical protein n=1 Tax=Ferrovum myxofaciens TaxID=416213 RepID=UPI0023556459|nr:hypothetical protein [Ferrovum myxofaciens]MBU6995912.1 hypothetical protein [Ferrovum myxofaciens]